MNFQRPPEYHLNDEELRNFVLSVFPVVLPAIYIDLEVEVIENCIEKAFY